MSAQDYYNGGGGGYPQHPQPSYGPQGQYGPPPGQYGPPQGQYGPPQGQYYGPPQGQPPMQYQQAPPPQQSGVWSVAIVFAKRQTTTIQSKYDLQDNIDKSNPDTYGKLRTTIPPF
ncbi:hypothetical protein F66182_8093 [Fusarium sp. NRRL 66182]|nr:hypothetical protein F66182_8093 [Fusarium sp. NRRL 66182]